MPLAGYSRVINMACTVWGVTGSLKPLRNDLFQIVPFVLTDCYSSILTINHFTITLPIDGLLLFLLIMLQTSAAKRSKFTTMSLDELQTKVSVLAAAGKEKIRNNECVQNQWNLILYMATKDAWQANYTCRMVLAVLLRFATTGMKLNLGPETNMSATGHVCMQHLICMTFSLRLFRFNRLFGVKLSTNRNL